MCFIIIFYHLINFFAVLELWFTQQEEEEEELSGISTSFLK